jgi:hypothetical protein
VVREELIMHMKDDDQMQTVLSSLEANRFQPVFAANREDAKKIILEMVPLDVRVGIGDAATLRQIGVIGELEKKVSEVINPFVRELTVDLNKYETFQRMLLESLRCDIFLASTNAITMDGKLVNIDGVGNRIAGTIFGPSKVILAVGRNKIVSDVDEALKRIKNVIAPTHAKHKKKRVPCATMGKCVDCNNEERLCNIIAIIEKKPHRGSISVIVIDEDLGLGWDVSWPEERRRRIEAEYGDVTWEFINPWHPKVVSQ